MPYVCWYVPYMFHQFPQTFVGQNHHGPIEFWCYFQIFPDFSIRCWVKSEFLHESSIHFPMFCIPVTADVPGASHGGSLCGPGTLAPSCLGWRAPVDRQPGSMALMLWPWENPPWNQEQLCLMAFEARSMVISSFMEPYWDDGDIFWRDLTIKIHRKFWFHILYQKIFDILTKETMVICGDLMCCFLME